MQRHPALLDSEKSALLVIDPQANLMPHIAGAAAILRNCVLLMEVATVLGIPVLATTQYAARLGELVPEIAKVLGVAPVFDKMTFSAAQDTAFLTALAQTERKQIVICGVETPICIAQTAADLQAIGYSVHVCPDAVGSRSVERHKLGMERIRDLGILPVSAEGAVYEWLYAAGTPQFKQVLPLIKGEKG
jgi:nicotinamidase-related amidase